MPFCAEAEPGAELVIQQQVFRIVLLAAVEAVIQKRF